MVCVSKLLHVKLLPLALLKVAGIRLHQVIAGENMVIWDDVPEKCVHFSSKEVIAVIATISLLS